MEISMQFMNADDEDVFVAEFPWDGVSPIPAVGDVAEVPAMGIEGRVAYVKVVSRKYIYSIPPLPDKFKLRVVQFQCKVLS